MKKINIVIIDDHALIREGIVALLENYEEINIVADFKNDDELLNFLEKNHVDVILQDIDLGAKSGIDVALWVKKVFPNITVLALSMFNDISSIEKMIEAGASGYIHKSCNSDELFDAIISVSNGGTFFSKEISETLFNSLKNKMFKNEAESEVNPLSAREIEVVKLISEEKTNIEISEILFISPRTVDAHKRNILDKLKVVNTAGVVKFAIKNKIIEI